jgi:hypothetical protein
MTSDPGDYVLGGRSYSYATPANNFRVGEDKHAIVISVGPWNLLMRAPDGHSLHPGHYRHTRRFGGSSPTLELFGDGRACDEDTGEFTLTRAVVDRYGWKTFAGSFEQHCEGGDPAARGTFSYRR